MKQFNDSVVYIREGKPVPAIVLKSQQTGNGEILTLLIADPVNGPGLLAQGTTRGIAQVVSAVEPMAEGKMFGWDGGAPTTTEAEPAEAPKSQAEETLNKLMPHLVNLSKTVSQIDPDMEISADGVVKSADELLQKQQAVLNQKPEPAPEQPASNEGEKEEVATQPERPTEGNPAVQTEEPIAASSENS